MTNYTVAYYGEKILTGGKKISVDMGREQQIATSACDAICATVLSMLSSFNTTAHWEFDDPAICFATVTCESNDVTYIYHFSAAVK